MAEPGHRLDTPNKLRELCLLNQLSNLYFLNYKLNLKSLRDLQQNAQYDIVLAFLVVHQMVRQDSDQEAEQLDYAKQYIDLLLALGRDVIIETSTEVFGQLDPYVRYLCEERGGEYLGELPRIKTKDPAENKWCYGRFYWFKNRSVAHRAAQKPSPELLRAFNGVYP